MGKSRWVWVAVMCLSLSCVWAQEGDSLRMDELGLTDIRADANRLAKDKQMVSGSRSLQSRDEVPFTAFVITKEEILDNGYITLTDVLKSLPGFRVSSVGSGEEGELFMLRGLSGNGYMKILINSVPVKPSVVKGMPIGAQLPVRQAERIEVIYGPAAVQYGADASAGVINIITRESERPVYVQADLSLGTNGHTHIEAMFGGKLGEGRNIVRYNVYGSSTSMAFRPVYHNHDSLFHPVYYNLPSQPKDTQYVNNPNYVGLVDEPKQDELPHLSNLVGMSISYRILTLTARYMYRRDHSSLGLNPLSVSYANRENFIGENMIQTDLRLAKDFKLGGKDDPREAWDFGFSTNLGLLRYNLDDNSSHSYVENRLSRAILSLTNGLPAPVKDSLRHLAFDTYFNGRRYSYAESQDFRFEQLFHASPLGFLRLTAGLDARLSFAAPLSNYLPVPYDDSGFFLSGVEPPNAPQISIPQPFLYGEWGAFAQTQWTWERFNMLAGYRYYKHVLYGRAHTPQFGALFKINDGMNVRATYGTAFRSPSPYYAANTYEISVEGITDVQFGVEDFRPERTDNYELGFRAGRDSVFQVDASLYHTITKNFISYNFDRNTDLSSELEYELGYFNDDGSQTNLYGAQLAFSAQKKWRGIRLKSALSLNYNIGKEILPEGKGTLDQVRAQPPFIGHLGLSLYFWEDDMYINISNLYASSHISKRMTSTQEPIDRFINDGYYVVDVLARYRISRNFQGYVKVKNLFNRQYAGIDASGTTDDLIYNPQQLRTLHFGLSYVIDD